jgi:hypothetical protein
MTAAQIHTASASPNVHSSHCALTGEEAHDVEEHLLVGHEAMVDASRLRRNKEQSHESLTSTAAPEQRSAELCNACDTRDVWGRNKKH